MKIIKARIKILVNLISYFRALKLKKYKEYLIFFLNRDLRLLIFGNKIVFLFKAIVLNFKYKHLTKCDEPSDLISYGLDACEIVYINLNHRTDRKVDTENEFKDLGVYQYSRIEAIHNENGLLGCAKSHLKAIRSNLNCEKLLMICEDDIEFNSSRDEIDNVIKEFGKNCKLSVLSLSYNIQNKVAISDKLSITNETQTMSCYIIKPKMFNIFIHFLEASIYFHENDIYFGYEALDQIWKKIQNDYIFSIPTKRLANQRKSYSDITHQIADYKV